MKKILIVLCVVIAASCANPVDDTENTEPYIRGHIGETGGQYTIEGGRVCDTAL